MELKYRWMLAPLLLASSVHAAEPNKINELNYDFLYADLSSGSLNESLGSDNNATALAVGGNYVWSDNILFTLDYSARFIHPKDVTTELYTLLPGVAYRYPVMDKLDVIATAKVGYLWAKQTLDSTEEKLFSDSKPSIGASIELKYALTEKWELAGRGEFNYTDLLEETLFNVRADYQFAERFTVGAFYTHRDGDFETARIKGSATTNEGGISLRYLF
ncbi:porin family protein [Vibrio tubiashii]|uniref:outer membrane beta-barrel protein n=1 Tax=Vibrio tubiashii TaxID=29498 RepID=UPI001EFE54DA|nr:outer membrane beta-barrel protein [Vibrio tubiashii]MCG9582281.1 porin family protein [Vibrio tubiashii]MCG9615872.1 porin family protein [Vibrio tubiashii]MCG9689561.1 porin family protein [Vibrio tubiashii]